MTLDKTGNVDYKAYALDLCQLLDEVDMRNEDEDLSALLKYRFEIAVNRGFTVEFLGPIEVGHA